MNGWQRLINRIFPKRKIDSNTTIPHLPWNRAMWLGWQSLWGFKARIVENEFFIYRISSNGAYAQVKVFHVLTQINDWTSDSWAVIDAETDATINNCLKKVLRERARLENKKKVEAKHR